MTAQDNSGAIPADIVAAAKAEAANFARFNPAHANMAGVIEYRLAGAVMAERERCILAVIDTARRLSGCSIDYASEALLDAIRKGDA